MSLAEREKCNVVLCGKEVLQCQLFQTNLVKRPNHSFRFLLLKLHSGAWVILMPLFVFLIRRTHILYVYIIFYLNPIFKVFLIRNILPYFKRKPQKHLDIRLYQLEIKNTMLAHRENDKNVFFFSKLCFCSYWFKKESISEILFKKSVVKVWIYYLAVFMLQTCNNNYSCLFLLFFLKGKNENTSQVKVEM